MRHFQHIVVGAGLIGGEIKSVLPLLGKPMLTNNQKAKSLLNINFISAEEMIKGSAKYLVDNGFIKA